MVNAELLLMALLLEALVLLLEVLLEVLLGVLGVLMAGREVRAVALVRLLLALLALLAPHSKNRWCLRWDDFWGWFLDKPRRMSPCVDSSTDVIQRRCNELIQRLVEQ